MVFVVIGLAQNVGYPTACFGHVMLVVVTCTGKWYLVLGL